METTKRNRIGEENPNYRGGKTISHGYVVLSSKIWGKDRGRYEHRVIMEEIIGRPLGRHEIVHHKNEDKTDNSPENLALLPSKAVHNRIHGAGRVLVCTKCGKERWFSPHQESRLVQAVETYLCRDCNRAALHTKSCKRCGSQFQGGFSARFCRNCTVKARTKKYRFFNPTD